MWIRTTTTYYAGEIRISKGPSLVFHYPPVSVGSQDIETNLEVILWVLPEVWIGIPNNQDHFTKDFRSILGETRLF